jgi:hypothetical protein
MVYNKVTGPNEMTTEWFNENYYLQSFTITGKQPEHRKPETELKNGPDPDRYPSGA